MFWVRVLFVLALSSTACLADPAFTLDQLEFHGWMARRKQGPETEVYVPLGQYRKTEIKKLARH